jgi:anthranilate 1,2-dioxygenase small subunit
MLVETIAFLAENASALDRADFDRWIEDFIEDCTYKVTSAENVSLGYDFPLMLMKNRNMILDRILSLREANVYNIHRDTHVLGLPVVRVDGDMVHAETAIAVYQTSQDGISALFCVGRYLDAISAAGGRLRLKSREVLIESFAIARLLSTPL